MSIEKLLGDLYKDKPSKRASLVMKKEKQKRSFSLRKVLLRLLYFSPKKLLPSHWLRHARLEKKLYYYTVVGLILLVGGGIFAFQLIFPHKGEAAWYDQNWLYRKAINITSHTSAENFVYIELSGGNAIDTSDGTRFQADCGDLRFTDASGKILPYYIVSGCGTSTTVVDINLDTFPAGAQTFYYYYGNPQAPNGFSKQGFPKAATSYTIGSIGSEENGPAPVAYWKLDDGYGNVATSSGSIVYPLQLTGATLPAWTSDQCIVGKCLFFNGITSNAFLSSTISNVKTISFWVNPSASAAAEILTLNNLVDIRTNGAGSVSANWVTSPTIYVNALQNSSTRQVATVSANTWNYVTITTSTGISASAIKLGKGPLGVLKGFIDEVKFYNYVRTSAQIQTDMAARGSKSGTSGVLGAQDSSFLSNGLVGYWKMDETAADTCSGGVNDSCDSSGNGYDGAWNGSAAASNSAKFAAGVTMPAAASRIAVSDVLDFEATDSFTLSAWIFKTDLTSTDTVIAKSNGTAVSNVGYMWYIGSTGKMSFILSDGTKQYQLQNQTAISTGRWVHVAVVFDGKNKDAHMYFDGADVSATSVGDPLTSVTGTTSNALVLTFGAESDNASNYEGVFDEFRIYNRAFGAQEIANLYDFAPGPVGYWNFEEGSGISLNDTSGNANTGTWSGADPYWTQGKYGKGGLFNGSNDVATILDSPSLSPTGLITVSAWVKLNFTPGASIKEIVGKHNSGSTRSYVLRVSNGVTGNFDFLLSTTGGAITTEVNSNTIAVPGRWYYVVGTYDGSIGRIYVNGVLERSVVSSSVGIFDSASSVRIGNDPEAAGRFFNGVIDEVKIYNYPRTQKQIVEDMSANHPAGNTNSTIGHWKFDDGFGTVASDSSQFRKNGSLYRAAWSNDSKFGKALFFDGNSYVQLGNVSEYKIQTKSVSFWAKPGSAISATQGVVAAGGNANWYTGFTSSSGSKMILSYKNAAGTQKTVNSTSNIDVLNWHHYAYTFSVDATGNNVTLKMYIDGKLDKTTTNTDGYSETYGSSFLLGSYAVNSNFYQGLLDEVKIYSYELAASDVKLDMNQGKSLVLGAFGMDSNGVASNSANAVYCVPGDTTQVCAPVAYWDMEEGSGRVINDKSTHGNDSIAFRGDVGFLRGKYGKGLVFDGHGDVVRIPETGTTDLGGTTDSYSVSAWFKTSVNYTLSGDILYKATTSFSPYALMLNTSANGCFQIAAANDNPSPKTVTKCGTTALNDGLWHYIVGVRDVASDSIITYIDGQRIGSATDTTTVSMANNDDISIGNGGSLYDNNGFTGTIDDVKIYNYSQTPAQIAWNYNHGKPIAWYKFDECQGTTLHDSNGSMSATLNLGSSGVTSSGTCTTAATAWGNGASGKFNYSLDLDGTDDAIYALSPDLPTNDFTASAWVNLGTATDETILMASKTGGDELRVHVNSSGQIELYTAGVLRVTSAKTIGTGSWNNIVVASSSGVQKIYINGQQDANTGSGTTQMDFKGCSLWIGVDVDSGCGGSLANYMDGKIDEVQLFNYPLTPVQVRTLYNQSSAVRFGPLTGTP